ncbi:SAYSvFN domain-containing protein 1 isoform X1 [Gadus chalcogrammus]|uniref:SAYSvFN domain-containing protein 1 isoform X1 n=2 Tax=Gadus chalcogrammus TaxID=1042646 RepID=UPI0024C495B5|nr:SAYSvFN domain-containing protein 1 isoform X1 [Gadus chalcogrammus]
MVDVHPFPQSGQVPVGAVMEQKLAEFRARRKAENATKTVESTANQPPRTSIALDTIEPTNEAALQAPTQANITSPYIERETIQVEDRSDWTLDSAIGRWIGSSRLCFDNRTLFKVLLWLVLLGLFAELEFGLPFFVLSLFYWMYQGLRSPAARQPGELSAYSVFNPDCQPILGAITVEQLEGEMGYHSLSA